MVVQEAPDHACAFCKEGKDPRAAACTAPCTMVAEQFPHCQVKLVKVNIYILSPHPTTPHPTTPAIVTAPDIRALV